jgi:hypothetical protein
MAIAQAIRWVIREFFAARRKDAGELTEEETRAFEAELRERILEATRSDRERWERVIEHLEGVESGQNPSEATGDGR